jgi:diguanylate cyclase (GGDEF)-like protein
MYKRPRCRVLLVEDNPADVMLLRDILDEHPTFSFQLTHFPRVQQAIEFLKGETADVVLLDYNLPDVDGLDGLARIVEVAPNLPILMLTGLDDEASGLRMVQHGAQDYLVKGFHDGAMLARAVRYAIERKKLSDRVRDSEERFTLAAAGSGDGIWDWLVAPDRLFLSPRAKAILGLAGGMPDGTMQIMEQRLHTEDLGRLRAAFADHLSGKMAQFRQQARVVDSNGQPRWVLIRGLVVLDALGRPRRMAGSITDLANLDSYYDSATGLPSRALLLDRLREVLNRRLRDAPGQSALLLALVTNYARLCETLGHAAGDALMTAVGEAITGAARSTDLVGRVSTSEIAVILDGLADADEVTAIAARIHRSLQAPVSIEGHEIVPTTRLGVVIATDAHIDPEAAMRDAASTLVAGPAGGPDVPVRMFNREMQRRASERLKIESVLRHALADDALKIVYQPVVALDGGALRGFEALLRWHDAELGQVPPSLFVPIAEEIGVIQEIGSWVLRNACRQVVAWRDGGLIGDGMEFHVSVNLSGRQLDDADAVDRILALIAATGVPSANLTLELTETALAADQDRASRALMAIKRQGIGLAMDDFGTGYSSLSFLGRFPFDKLKIDQSFVNTIADAAASPLLKGMTCLTRELGMHVIAEGVETAEQRDVLNALGCQDGQGWLFGRPLDADGAEALLRRFTSAPPGVGAAA